MPFVFTGDFRKADCEPKPKHKCHDEKDDDGGCRKPKRKHHHHHHHHHHKSNCK